MVVAAVTWLSFGVNCSFSFSCFAAIGILTASTRCTIFSVGIDHTFGEGLWYACWFGFRVSLGPVTQFTE